MQSSEIRERYLKFFEKRGHKIIPSASLVPENDPSSLFTTAGMQPLVPYLLGAKHPAGTRLVDVQKCVRTGDIEDVGDNRHLTFFEMLGNWSFGDYFKKEAIEWSLEFLTSKEEGLGLDINRLYVTVFKGEDGIPRDEDSIKFWKANFAKHNIKAEVAGTDETIQDAIKIIPLGKDDNFWIAGTTGPCGGDTEMFYDVLGKGKVEGKFQDLVKSGRIIEIWNDVFMEFNKTVDGKYEKLPKPNVDTGMGLERTTVVMQGKSTVFDTDIFKSLLSKIQELAIRYDEKSGRIIADHIRAATFMISDGVVPSNTEQGYVLRRLLRRAIIHSQKINMNYGLEKDINGIFSLADIVIEKLGNVYPNLKNQKDNIKGEILKEEMRFKQTLEKGLKEFEKFQWMGVPDEELLENTNRTVAFAGHAAKVLTGEIAFNLFQTYGFPTELIEEIAKEKGILLSPDFKRKIEDKFKEHQEISKAGSEQKFKGGLAGTGEMETKYHTATHMLLASLQKVLKSEIVQKGSNITAERLRFDFNWPEKVPADKLKEVEDLVNQKIQEKLPVEMVEMPKEEAQKIVTTFCIDLSKYADTVKVYKIGVKDGSYFSIEFCGGPHVKNTGDLGHFKIVKEEASSAGVRRIKAVLE